MKIYSQIYERFMERFKERSDASPRMLPNIFARFKERCMLRFKSCHKSNKNPALTLQKIATTVA